MQEATDYQPTDDDVKHIWSDTYKFFLQYKDVDCVDLADEIVLAYNTISDNYNNCELAKGMLDSVMMIFKSRSKKYQELVKSKG